MLPFLCFIDLLKAYDSLCRLYTSWQLLARFGVPPLTIEVIDQFYDWTKPCVRSDDGRCSEGLEVAQGVREK